MASLCHKVKLRKLMKEHMKRQVETWEAASYTARETSTNLSSRTASTDLGLKHREADTMMLSAQVKLSKSTCSRQRWHRRVRASSECLASTTRASADQKQECVYQLLCRALRRCSKHHHASLHVITSSDHTSVWLLRPWQKETAATSDHGILGKRALRTGRWKSGVTKQSQSWYENIRPPHSCPKSTCLHENACVTYGQATASRWQTNEEK